MPNRRLSCLVGERCVGRLEFVQQSQAGLPGRLAGLLPAAFLATALPRRTLFQRVVFCMIDHGLLPASPSWAQVVPGCLGGKTTRQGCNIKVWSSWVVSPVQSSPVQSTESRWTGPWPSRAMWSVDLWFVVASCPFGQTLFGGSGILHFTPLWLLDANCFLLCPDSNSSLVRTREGLAERVRVGCWRWFCSWRGRRAEGIEAGVPFGLWLSTLCGCEERTAAPPPFFGVVEATGSGA